MKTIQKAFVLIENRTVLQLEQLVAVSTCGLVVSWNILHKCWHHHDVSMSISVFDLFQFINIYTLYTAVLFLCIACSGTGFESTHVCDHFVLGSTTHQNLL